MFTKIKNFLCTLLDAGNGRLGPVEDSDDKQYMWEAVMIKFFGPDVFKWINQECH